MLKVFGSKLKTNQLRMITIQDKLTNMENIVENVHEQKVVPVAAVDEGQPKTAYTAVDDDAVDLAIKAFLAKNEVSVTITRLQENLYQIGDKTLSVKLDKEDD